MIGWWLAACASSEPAPPPAPVASPPAAPAPTPRLTPGPDLVGLCDASAAVVVGRWLVVADDERNVLQVFDTDSGAPAAPIDLGAMHPDLRGKEADFEGFALTGDGRAWLIGSHDSGKGTTREPSRQRLLALSLVAGDAGVTATLAAGPTARLVEEGQYGNPLYGVVSNTVGHTSKDPLGLSIEGLAAGPAGSLLLGFRTPIHGGKALIERLDDPVAAATGGELRFTGPRWVDLGGRGIRSLEADGDGFLLVAGAADDEIGPALYRWRGFDDGSPAEPVPVDLAGLNPEGLVRVGDRWWLLSDDGNRRIDGQKCKDLPSARRRARTASLDLPPPGGQQQQQGRPAEP